MTPASIGKTVALGAITGMRSMSGAATLALQHDGLLKRALPMLAAAEMIADKTSLVGNRTDAAPLAARAIMGAVLGGVIAYEDDGNVVLGGAIGAAAAVTAAHLAFHARRRLQVSTAVGGALEDAVVLALSSWFMAQHAGRRAL